MSSDNQYQNDDGLAVEEDRPKVKQPPMYQVVLLNDDYTPMEFVVHILESFFNMGREQATRVMLNVHAHGKGVCGVFTREVSETKVINDPYLIAIHYLRTTFILDLISVIPYYTISPKLVFIRYLKCI